MDDKPEANDVQIVDLFAFIQMKAIETTDERIQQLADAAYALLDEKMIKALLLQRATENQSRQHISTQSPILQMLDRAKR